MNLPTITTRDMLIQPTEIMKKKIKIHDEIVGSIILFSVILALTVNVGGWLYLTGAIGGLMISNTFTGFCPVYFVLNRVLPAE